MSMPQLLEETCALCAQDLPSPPLYGGDKAFCCHGCQAVYAILSAKGSLEHWQTSSIYQEAVRAGIVSNPLFSPPQQERSLDDTHSFLLLVEGMWCPACAQLIAWILGQRKGITYCHVDYATDIASIRYDPKCIGKEEITQLITQMGYVPSSFAAETKPLSSSLVIRTVIAVFFTLQVMFFSYPLYGKGAFSPLYGSLAALFSLPVLLVGLIPLFRRFFFGILAGMMRMETLVILSTTTGFVLSIYSLFVGESTLYFDSICALLSFILLGKCLEQKAKFSAKESLHTLYQSMPRKGRKVVADGHTQFVPLKEIVVGDCVVILPGEKIVLDGVVVEGEGNCDESFLSGEVLPKAKKQGSPVLSGSLFCQGKITFRVTNPPDETAYRKLLTMLEGDLPQKQQEDRFIDRLIPFFVPFVLALATSTLFFAPQNALSVLLIACPCSIGIAAPLAEALLLFRLAKRGILVRNRRVLSILGKEDLYVFDKTGTLTEGRCTLERGLEELTRDEKSYLKGLATSSTHPLSQSIAQTIEEEEHPFSSTKEHISLGVEGEADGKRFFLGSATFLQRYGIAIPEFSVPLTCVYFAVGTTVRSTLLFHDRIREEVPALLQQLDMPTALLSGDSFGIVRSVAQTCKIDTFSAQCHPLEKREKVLQWKEEGRVVAMVGDGINDAPALAVADMGIAVFSATDASKQVADIFLTHPRMDRLLEARHDARKTQRIIRQNLFWAFGYNTIGLGLAMMGLLTPLFAAIGMIVSSTITLGNSWRLRKEESPRRPRKCKNWRFK